MVKANECVLYNYGRLDVYIAERDTVVQIVILAIVKCCVKPVDTDSLGGNSSII